MRAKPRLPRLEGDTPQPVVCLPLHERGGTVVHDVSGNHIDGTISGPSWSQGPAGACLEYAGSAHYVAYSLPAALPTWTLLLRARLDAPAQFDRIWSTGTANHWSFSAANIDANQVTLGSSAIWTGQDIGLTAGEWVVIALTYDGATVTAYTKGVPVTSASTAGKSLPSGTHHIGNLVGTSTRALNGAIALFEVYDVALPAGLLRRRSADPYEHLRPAAPSWLGAVPGAAPVARELTARGEGLADARALAQVARQLVTRGDGTETARVVIAVGRGLRGRGSGSADGRALAEAARGLRVQGDGAADARARAEVAHGLAARADGTADAKARAEVAHLVHLQSASLGATDARAQAQVSRGLRARSEGHPDGRMAARVARTLRALGTGLGYGAARLASLLWVVGRPLVAWLLAGPQARVAWELEGPQARTVVLLAGPQARVTWEEPMPKLEAGDVFTTVLEVKRIDEAGDEVPVDTSDVTVTATLTAPDATEVACLVEALTPPEAGRWRVTAPDDGTTLADAGDYQLEVVFVPVTETGVRGVERRPVEVLPE